MFFALLVCAAKLDVVRKDGPPRFSQCQHGAFRTDAVSSARLGCDVNDLNRFGELAFLDGDVTAGRDRFVRAIEIDQLLVFRWIERPFGPLLGIDGNLVNVNRLFGCVVTEDRRLLAIDKRLRLRVLRLFGNLVLDVCGEGVRVPTLRRD